MKSLNFNNSIQGIRTICFIFIFLFHCNVIGFEFGWFGIETFFVISGFMLTQKLLQNNKKDIDFINLTKKRLIRLYPEYILILIGAILLYVLAKKSLPNDIIFYLTSSQNFFWFINGYNSDLSSFMGHTWTLAIEIQLFIINILIFKFSKLNNYKITLIFEIVLAVVFRFFCIYYLKDNAWLASLLPIFHIDAYAFGGLIATCINDNSKIENKVSWWGCIGLLGTILVIVMLSKINNIEFFSAYQLLSISKNYLNNYSTVQIYFFISLISGYFLYNCLINKNSFLLKSVFENKMCIFIGNMSFTLYIFHYPVIVFLKKFIDNKVLIFLLGIILTFILTFVYRKLEHKYKELKLRRKKNNDTVI